MFTPGSKLASSVHLLAFIFWMVGGKWRTPRKLIGTNQGPWSCEAVGILCDENKAEVITLGFLHSCVQNPSAQ